MSVVAAEKPDAVAGRPWSTRRRVVVALAVRPAPADAAPAPAVDAEKTHPAGTPWNVVVDRAALRHGRFRLRDRVAEPPETAALALDALVLERFTLRRRDGEPGHGTVEAKFGDGVIRLDNTITTRDEGFAIETV